MSLRVTLYSRVDCCLCDEMKALLRSVGRKITFEVEEIDVDSDPHLQQQYGHEVPVLLINGRKAFKVRTTERELRNRLSVEDRRSSIA
jgi:glutaredoxin